MNIKFGSEQPPLIIAEMSGNHNGSLKRALQIVDAAAAAGAHALKIQTYTADTMTLDLKKREFFISDPKSLWKGHSLYELYQKASTPWEWHKAIFDRCRERRIIGFSSPFDQTAVDFLERLKVPLYKIASFENVDLALIRRVAMTGKPVIISTGLASKEELKEAVKTARDAGCKQLLLLKCTSAYPAKPKTANLATLPHLSKLFNCPVGLSDHTLGSAVSVASIAYGAVAIERHITLSRRDGGVDSAFSLEPEELKRLVQDTRSAWEARGKITYGPSKEEAASLRFRRSLYVAKDMNAGDEFTEENLRSIRPGLGLAPKYLDVLIGRRAKMNITKGTAASWSLVSGRSPTKRRS